MDSTLPGYGGRFKTDTALGSARKVTIHFRVVEGAAEQSSHSEEMIACKAASPTGGKAQFLYLLIPVTGCVSDRMFSGHGLKAKLVMKSKSFK